MKTKTHQIELNLYYMHYNDAIAFKNIAKKTPKENFKKYLYSRHSIISIVFAAEALINRVLDKFYIYESELKTFEKLSLFNKWLIAPLICGDKQPVGKIFDKSKEPFQSFKELIDIRNCFAHPKPNTLVPAYHGFDTITVLHSENHEENEELPLFDVVRGDVWSQTKIPKNPFEITETHAEKAIEIFNRMQDELLVKFTNVFDDKWFNSIKVITLGADNHIENLSTDILWDGYTPNEL